jgi:hypothetical protein
MGDQGGKSLDDARDARRAYHNRLTVAKTFARAIDAAAKRHPAVAEFALIDRETIPDEREFAITTACICLHRPVRQFAAARLKGDALREKSGINGRADARDIGPERPPITAACRTPRRARSG